MGICRRSITGLVAAILGLSIGVSGCVTTGTDVVQESPTVRGQMPSAPAATLPALPGLPPAAPTAPYRTTYTYVPADGMPNATNIVRLPNGPAGAPLSAPVSGAAGAPHAVPMTATLTGPRTTPGAAHGPGDVDAFNGHPAPGPIPTELNKYSHPPYTIAPPDILVIDAIRLIPKPPYRIEALTSNSRWQTKFVSISYCLMNSFSRVKYRRQSMCFGSSPQTYSRCPANSTAKPCSGDL